LGKGKSFFIKPFSVTPLLQFAIINMLSFLPVLRISKTIIIDGRKPEKLLHFIILFMVVYSGCE
jgi:hypothetical protein